MSDSIDRTLAIATLVMAKETGSLMCKELKGVIEVLNRMPPAQQWIPCSERLPEDHEPKLLTHEVHYITGKVIKDVRMAYYDDENDDWLSDEESPEILCYPLAWMPLPEPYKGEKHE